MILIWAILYLFVVALILETVGRILYRRHFLVPFRPKIVGEYPFRTFIVEEDPPLFFSFRKGFHSPEVSFNRFGIRGPEPASDGSKKRILVIGESNIFGIKLRNEKNLWSIQLERMLAGNGHEDWEVLNAGNPGYNTFQHRAFWERELRETKPDILLVSMGINEITQAWVMGSTWKPGEPWPIEFIYALERKSSLWNKAAGYSCLYFLLRRMGKGVARDPFTPKDDGFKWAECKAAIFENYRAIIEDAQSMGAHVATFEGALAYDFQLSEDDKRRISSIQHNWDTFLKGKARYDYELLDTLAHSFAPQMGVPHMNLAEDFRRNPRRFELYYDLGHVNGDGMTVYAQAFYDHLDKLGWLKQEGVART
jgi:lysophospholipase L1-like esterase